MSAAGRLSVEFAFSGHGWIDIRLARGGARHELLGLSYLTEVLEDLLRAALPPQGDYRATADFALEPGLLQLACEQRGAATLLQVIDYNRDIYDPPGRGCSRLEWEVHLSGWREFAEAVASGARALEAKVGRDGYAAEWGSPFPGEALARLEKALA